VSHKGLSKCIIWWWSGSRSGSDDQKTCKKSAIFKRGSWAHFWSYSALLRVEWAQVL